MSTTGHLTGKQAAFVEAYLCCWNATEAARRAGYAGNNGTLNAVGYENLRKPQIKEAISERLQETVTDSNVALAHLWSLATADPGDLAEVMRETTPPAAMAVARKRGVSRLVKKIQQTAHGVTVEWHDPVRALEIVMRHIAPTRVELGLERLDVAELSNADLEHVVRHGRLPR